MHRGCLVCVICNSNKCSFLYLQTLHIDCAHIEYVHLLFCAQFMKISHFLGLLDLEIFTCVALAKASLVMGPLRPSVRPSVRPKHFRGTKFVYSVTPKVFIPFHSNFAK